MKMTIKMKTTSKMIINSKIKISPTPKKKLKPIMKIAPKMKKRTGPFVGEVSLFKVFTYSNLFSPSHRYNS